MNLLAECIMYTFYPRPRIYKASAVGPREVRTFAHLSCSFHIHPHSFPSDFPLYTAGGTLCDWRVSHRGQRGASRSAPIMPLGRV